MATFEIIDETLTGWLSPSGKFYPTISDSNIQLEKVSIEICDELNIEIDINPPQTLLENSWIILKHDSLLRFKHSGDSDTLIRDYSDEQHQWFYNNRNNLRNSQLREYYVDCSLIEYEKEIRGRMPNG